MSGHPFSVHGRRRALDRMGQENLDLLVIGGGITGCGVAREAACAGLRVALVEREDFAAGTSSRSSKLIHTGLRYLLQGEVGLVREAGRERAALQALAPHLVRPLPFLLPLYPGDRPTWYRAGFWLLDRLIGAAGPQRHWFLSPDQVRAWAPALGGRPIGGVVYGEYGTDDARLTLENALSAALHGALVANHAPVVALRATAAGPRGGEAAGGRGVEARVRDALTGGEYRIRARVVVNATGAWAAATLALAGQPAPGRVLPSKGIHLLFPARRLPLRGAVVLRAPTGRQGFAIRRGEWVYVGTTDQAYSGPLDRPDADAAAAWELLELARSCFPGAALTAADIQGAWAGLRPLVARPGRSPRETSRRDAIWPGPPGILTVVGGKLTTYRAMARRILARVLAELGWDRDRQPGCRQPLPPLPGGDFGGADPEAAMKEAAAALGRRGVNPAAAERAAALYGSRVTELLRQEIDDPAWLRPLAPGVPVLRGEVRLAVEQEMAGTLLDFMDRRSGLLLFGPDHGLAAVGAAAGIMAELLGWSAAEEARQVEAYREAVSRHRLTL